MKDRRMGTLCAGLVCAIAQGAPRRRLDPTFIKLERETVVASAVVTDAPYHADSTGRRDATAAIQRALDDVAGVNGGVVFMPAGRYRIDGELTVGYGTTLMGEWHHPDRGGIGKGTILLAYASRGRESGKPLITLPAHRETGLKNVTVWYPEQQPDDIAPYPFTIAGGTAHVENVTLCNSYNGIHLAMFSACVVANVCGTVLSRGIVAPESFEFSWMHEVRLSNDYWREAAQRLGSGAMTLEQNTALDQFTAQHLVGLEIGRLDALAIYRFAADGAATPVVIRKNDKVSQHRVHGFGGLVAAFPRRRVEHGWDPWYYGMHYANVDNVPEAANKSYAFAAVPMPRRTDPESFIDVTAPPYSAAGDGMVDDTAALQRALDAAGKLSGGTVYLPQGEFKVTQPLVVPAGVELRGPLGAGKIRQFRETCSLAVYCGRGSEDPGRDPASITLMDHAGVRGFNIVYPEQAYDVAGLQPFPYAIRGNGEGVWIVDMHLLNAYHGIDLASHRCDRHVLSGLWATVFHKGIDVGGGSRGGKLERIAFSYGPWAEAARARGLRTDALKKAMAEYCKLNSVHYSFGDCVGETAWGLVGFYPNVHYHFYKDRGRGCVDAEFWQSMHDVAHLTNLKLDAGENISLFGYFGTGGRDKMHNWLEVAPDFRGPLNVYAKTIERKFLNHPYGFASEQVRFFDERSLITGKPATARTTAPGSDPANAVDRDPRSIWQAPAGSWLDVDLGSVKVIDRFGIESAGLFMDGALNTIMAEMHVSLDGRAFRRAGTLWTGKFAWADMPIDPTRARHVRLLVRKPGEDGTIRIATFSAFGPPD